MARLDAYSLGRLYAALIAAGAIVGAAFAAIGALIDHARGRTA
jgi:hypothetical protein